MLIIMSGLPGTGKTTIARALAHEIGAVHLRIDTIEQAVVRAGGRHPVGPVGYVVGCALAADFMVQGLTVVVDSVNPLRWSREAWWDVARDAAVAYLDVEVVCSDPAEHERRVTNRVGDIAGLPLPAWSDIQRREYEPWGCDRLVVDTARRAVSECVTQVRSALGASAGPGCPGRPGPG